MHYMQTVGVRRRGASKKDGKKTEKSKKAEVPTAVAKWPARNFLIR
jgi:hypothetical protein